jgi:hypothetical protein
MPPKASDSILIDGEEYTRCTGCGQIKLLRIEFDALRTVLSGRRARCKACGRKGRKSWRPILTGGDGCTSLRSASGTLKDLVSVVRDED